jgi:hypothetical protein
MARSSGVFRDERLKADQTPRAQVVVCPNHVELSDIPGDRRDSWS